MSTPKKNELVQLNTVDLTDIAEELRAVQMSAQASDTTVQGRAQSWIQVAKLGTFKGHVMGPFEFTTKVFDTIIRNFEQTSNREVPVDFEHATEMHPADGDIPSQGAPATGWITRLDNRGNAGLWGLVDWLEPGLSYVRSGRYRYFSPAVVFNYRHGVTGESVGPVLVSGGLTNRPFLDGMAPVTARAGAPRGKATKMNTEEMLKVLSLALGDEGKELTEENVGERVTDIATRLKAAETQVTTLAAEKKAVEMKSAEAEVDALIAAKIIDNTPDSRANAIEVRLSHPKTFASMFSARLRGVKSAPVSGNGPEGKGAVITAADEKSLTEKQAPAGGAPTPRTASSAVEMRMSDVIHERAVKLMSDKPEEYRSKKGAVPNPKAYAHAEEQVMSERRANA